MKIQSASQALNWAKSNPKAVVTRTGYGYAVGKVENTVIDHFFMHFWDDIIVATGVNSDFSLEFTKLSELDDGQTFPRTNEQYVASPDECPFCGSANITSHGEHAIEGSLLFNECECISCKKKWDERYDLAGYSQS